MGAQLPPGAVLDAQGLPPGAVLDAPDQWHTPGGLWHYIDPKGVETMGRTPPPAGSKPYSPAVASLQDTGTLQIAPGALIGIDKSFDTGIPISGAVNDKLTRLGRGAEDIWQGGHQLVLDAHDKLAGTHDADAYTAAKNAEIAHYEAARAAEGNTGIDWMRGLGTMATPLGAIPGAGGTLGRTALLGAAAGASAGALRYDPGNSWQDRAVNTAAGGVTGAVLAPLAQVGVQGAIRGVQGVGNLARSASARLGDLLGTGSQEAEQAAAKASGPAWSALDDGAKASLVSDARAQMETGAVDPVMLERKANLLANGVTPTRSMVTRSPRDWTIERNLQKSEVTGAMDAATPGDQLTAIYQGNDKALTGRLSQMLDGLPAGTQEARGANIMDAVDALQRAKQAEVRSAYQATSAARGEGAGMQPAALPGALADLQDNAYAAPMANTVAARLAKLGTPEQVVQNPASRIVGADGQPLIPAGEATTIPRQLTVDQAEELRKYIGAQPDYAGGTPLKGFKAQLVRALDQDVMGTAGDDPFAAARGAARDRFQILGNPAVQKAMDAYGELAEGKTAQNFIRSNVVSGSIKDVQALVQSFGKIPDADVQATALGSLKAGVLQHLYDQAVNPNNGAFSGAKLATAMKDFGGGSDEKLVATVGQDAADKLKSLARAGLDATYQPSHSAPNYSNTAPTLLRMIQAARALPVVGKLSEWGVPQQLEKQIEEKAVREQLARALAAQAETGSTAQLETRQALASQLVRALRPQQVVVGLAQQPRPERAQ